MDYQPNYEYTYDGPVMVFDRCVYNRWIATTKAPSEGKARANLAFRYKKQYGLANNAKVYLPGKLSRGDKKE